MTTSDPFKMVDADGNEVHLVSRGYNSMSIGWDPDTGRLVGHRVDEDTDGVRVERDMDASEIAGFAGAIGFGITAIALGVDEDCPRWEDDEATCTCPTDHHQ